LFENQFGLALILVHTTTGRMGEQPSCAGLRRRDPVLITKAIGDMVRAQIVTKFAQRAGLPRKPLQNV
jgi:hypothetical protein